MALGQKEFAIGDSKFLIKNFNCDNWLVMLAKLTKILSKPASILFKDGINGKEAEGKFADALSSIFENVAPEDLPALIDEVTKEVEWKKTGNWQNLNEVKDVVFLENKADRLKVCQEVLMYNYRKEIGRFFGSLPSMKSLMSEAINDQAVTTSSPVVPGRIKAQ